MIEGIKQRLDQVSESRARNFNMFFSTLAGIIYLFIGLQLESLSTGWIIGGILTATVFDWSTVYFVHSGVLAGTLDRIMDGREASIFMKLHLWPGLIGYVFLAGFLASIIFYEGISYLYLVFLAGWMTMYLSGLYPYLKLTR
jgi:hypothetical protein